MNKLELLFVEYYEIRSAMIARIRQLRIKCPDYEKGDRQSNGVESCLSVYLRKLAQGEDASHALAWMEACPVCTVNYTALTEKRALKKRLTACQGKIFRWGRRLSTKVAK